MKRKIIKQGLGGYTIYLPKKWVESKGLKPGDEINISEYEKDLILSGEKKENKEISLDLDEEKKEDIINILTHIYRKGFNKITLKNSDTQTIKKIKSLDLLGFEIIETSKNKCVLENITEPTDQKYEKIVQRLLFLLKETHNLTIEDLKNKKYSNKQDLYSLRKQFDKFVLFCKRILVKEKYKQDPVIEWEFLTFLMHIQHAYYYLYKYSFENKVKLTTSIKFLDDLESYLDLFIKAYKTKDISYINKINKQKNQLHFGKILDELEKSKGKETITLSYIRELFRLIQIGTSPILVKHLEQEIKD